MTGFDRILLIIAAVTSACLYLLTIMLLLSKSPPAYCAYYVPVKGHPNVYTCSYDPRARGPR